MSVNLNPITLEKIERFGRRRRRMVLLRGICAATVSILALMSLVALADWRWVLSDSMRWTLSAVGYAGAAAVVWLTCLRLIVRCPNQKDLARRVETAEPRLRENLLSAVELAIDAPNQPRDSSTFRQILQDHVGRQMENVDIRSLLPLRLLGKWLLAATVIVVTCGILLSLPGLPFRQLMTRALLPGANIDRVSRIHVTILQPTPHSLTIPQEDAVAVVVEISGGHVKEVTLELHTKTNGVARQQMRVTGAARYTANVSVGSEPIEYRILAGDAVTRKYTIHTRPRPTVVSFLKTYHFPEYAGLDDQTVTESHGDLIALQGTEVELVLELDQDVSEAELRLDRADLEETQVIALEPIAARRLRAMLLLEKPGIYKVHLVSKETAFENTFSPKYEIKPEPDLIPRVEFVGLRDANLLLPPNDILDMEGLAEDDLPLAGLAQHISVNGRPWQSVPLEIKATRRVTAAWRWDLLELSLKSGDQVTTKLVATDRKGNVGESVPLNIIVSSPDFDPDRHAVMERKAEFYDTLVELADVVARHKASAEVIIRRIGETNREAGLDAQDRASLLDLASKVRDETDRVFKRLLEILPTMPAGVEADELELAGGVIARVRYQTMNAPGFYLDAFANAEEPEQAAKDLQQVMQSFAKSAEYTGQLARQYQRALAHDIMAAIAYDLDALLRHQELLFASHTPLTWQRLLRQETVTINQIHVLEQLIGKHSPRLPESSRRALRSTVSWATESRARLEEATESEEQKQTLEKLARDLVRELGGRQNADMLDSHLPRHLVDARKRLDAQIESIHVPIARLAQSAAKFEQYANQAAESDDSVQSRQFRRAAERSATEIHELHLSGMARLDARKKVTQLRPDSDAQYAADAGMTRRAVTALASQFARNATPESEQSDVPSILAQIAPAYHILESGHEAIQLQRALVDLLALERWNSREISARLDHPRQWDAVHNGLETVARKLREARFPDKLASRLDNLRWSRPARNAGQKISARRYKHDPIISAARDLAELHAMLNTIIDDMLPIMEEARALIAQHVPTISEMAQQAAEELRHLEKQTTDVADQLTQSEREQVDPRLDKLRQQQRQANAQIEDLVEALVEDANSQDLLTDQGRHRARDADDSVAMIEDPARQMNKAMQKAAAAQQPDDQARDLSQAAEKQEQTADVLDQIAEHFERLDAGEDVAQSRNALRQAERDMGIARQMDQRYDAARQLGELAAKSAEQLLAELEAELQKNPAMQDALSEISQDVVRQARNALEFSAEQEDNLQRTVERADPKFEAGKKEMAESLRDIGQEASRLAHNVVAQADNAATRGQSQPAHEALSKARQKLTEATAASRKVHGDSTLNDIRDAAREMAALLEQTSNDLAQAQTITAKAKDDSIHDTQQQRAERQREAEQNQKRVHDQKVREAKERTRAREQVERRAKQQVRSAETALRRAASQVQTARRKVTRKPDDAAAKEALAQADARRVSAQAQADQAKQQTEEAKRQTAAARQVAKKLEQQPLRPLTAANPAAELANRLATEAKEAAEELTRRAKELGQEPAWSREFKPEAQQLASAANQQQEIGRDVAQTAEDVARAARHERRLDKPPISNQLENASDNIQQVADGEVADSRQQLNDAAQSRQTPAAIAANASVKQAEQAITRQAEALDAILDASAESGQPAGDSSNQARSGQEQSGQEASGQNPSGQEPSGQSQSGQSSSGQAQSGQASDAASQAGQQSPSEVARAQLLAQTLDDLDRAAAAGQADAGQAAAGQADAGAPSSQRADSSSLAQAARAQAAGMAQSRIRSQMMARSRGQASSEGALESANGAAVDAMSSAEFSLEPVNRLEGEDWGRLRDKSAQDLTEGRRESISAEYRKRVETYFRVIAQRARKKK